MAIDETSPTGPTTRPAISYDYDRLTRFSSADPVQNKATSVWMGGAAEAEADDGLDEDIMRAINDELTGQINVIEGGR